MEPLWGFAAVAARAGAALSTNHLPGQTQSVRQKQSRSQLLETQVYAPSWLTKGKSHLQSLSFMLALLYLESVTLPVDNLANRDTKIATVLCGPVYASFRIFSSPTTRWNYDTAPVCPKGPRREEPSLALKTQAWAQGTVSCKIWEEKHSMKAVHFSFILKMTRTAVTQGDLWNPCWKRQNNTK